MHFNHNLGNLNQIDDPQHRASPFQSQFRQKIFVRLKSVETRAREMYPFTNGNRVCVYALASFAPASGALPFASESVRRI